MQVVVDSRCLDSWELVRLIINHSQLQFEYFCDDFKVILTIIEELIEDSFNG